MRHILGGFLGSISWGQSGKVPWQLGKPLRFIERYFLSVGLMVRGRIFRFTVIRLGFSPLVL